MVAVEATGRRSRSSPALGGHEDSRCGACRVAILGLTSVDSPSRQKPSTRSPAPRANGATSAPSGSGSATLSTRPPLAPFTCSIPLQVRWQVAAHLPPPPAHPGDLQRQLPAGWLRLPSSSMTPSIVPRQRACMVLHDGLHPLHGRRRDALPESPRLRTPSSLIRWFQGRAPLKPTPSGANNSLDTLAPVFATAPAPGLRRLLGNAADRASP